MKQSHDAIIIGTGLFGQIIGDTLLKDGLVSNVLWIDSDEPFAGSRPAACLMKPSWFSSMGKNFQPSLELLDRLYGVQDLSFKTTGLDITVHWVKPKQVLRFMNDYSPSEQILRAKVLKIEQGAPGEWLIHTNKSPCLNTRLLIVAAGVWTNDLLGDLPAARVPGLVGKAGCAFTWKNQLRRPEIKPWAPYKQLVAFNLDEEEVWVGDGTAILTKNFTPERIAESEKRCRSFISATVEGFAQVGYRPYASCGENPAWLSNMYPGLWTACGGAKNGTIAAAWCANEIKRRL